MSKKKLGLDSTIMSWDLKNRIPHQKLRIYSNAEDYRSESRSKYLKFDVSVLYEDFGFKNSGLTLEFRFLVGIGRSGVMIGRLCLNMVS